MPTFLLVHRHEPFECESAFAAWAGFESPLRHQQAASTCLRGEHGLWWQVQAADDHAALALLPPFVAGRTSAIEVRQVRIP